MSVLLRQPHGFEGLRVIPEVLPVHDPALAHGNDLRHLQVSLRAHDNSVGASMTLTVSTVTASQVSRSCSNQRMTASLPKYGPGSGQPEICHLADVSPGARSYRPESDVVSPRKSALEEAGMSREPGSPSRHRGHWVFAFLAVAVCSSLVATPAHAAFPGANGKIAFHTDRDGTTRFTS